MPSISTEVRVTPGPTTKAAIHAAAISAVRFDLPPTSSVSATITGHTRDGHEAVYTVSVSYVPRDGATEPTQAPVVPAGVFGGPEDDEDAETADHTDPDGVDAALDALAADEDAVTRAVKRASRKGNTVA